jgi:membrane-associated progesterone receptor component
MFMLLNYVSFTFIIYHIFAGRDATKALAKTSLEEEDLDKDATGLSADEVEALDKFYNLYTKKYVPIGKYVVNSKL